MEISSSLTATSGKEELWKSALEWYKAVSKCLLHDNGDVAFLPKSKSSYASGT
jgi:hypothetical protein